MTFVVFKKITTPSNNPSLDFWSFLTFFIGILLRIYSQAVYPTGKVSHGLDKNYAFVGMHVRLY